MIAKLNGVVDSQGDDWLIIDVNGVGYLLWCSGRTLNSFGLGEVCRLWVDTRMREEMPQLYGFASVEEQQWFRQLTTIQGVGPKAALAILTVLAPTDIVAAAHASDKAAFQRADGVGPKLAARILAELQEKVKSLPPATLSNSSAPASAEQGLVQDALSALVNWGYGRSEAYAAINKAIQEKPPIDFAELIRQSLAILKGVRQ
ncbi:MAG: Holliday junction branch migration protein RuvA [Alphaproteobacteria bacterium]